MSAPIWAALIGAAGLLAAAYLAFALRSRAQRLIERRKILQAQLDRVYGPIFDILKDAVSSDEDITEIDDEDVHEIVEIARSNGKFLEPRLEAIIDSISERLWSDRQVRARDLEALFLHVTRKYNELKKALGLPHVGRRR